MIVKLTRTQVAISYHRFANGQRPKNGDITIHQEWNELDEEAYQAILFGNFEWEDDLK